MSAPAAAETVEPKPTAIAARPAMDFVPRNVDEAFRMAEMLGKSGLLPEAVRGKPFDVLVILMTGAEFGISPMAALREVYVVKGKGYISSLMKQGLVLSSPHCEYFRLVESNAKRAIYETKRRGAPEPVRLAFTIEEAIAAGLASAKPGGQDNWSKYPTLMLRRRCGGQLADDVYPDVTRGLGSSDDELVEAIEQERTFSGTTAPTAPNPVKTKSNTSARAPKAAAPPADAEVVDPVTGEVTSAPAPDAPPVPPSPVPAAEANADVELMAQIEAFWTAAKTRDDVMATIPLLKKLSAEVQAAYRSRYNAKLQEMSHAK